MTKSLIYIIGIIIYASIATLLIAIPELFNMLSVQIATLCFLIIPPILYYTYTNTRTEDDVLDENYYEETNNIVSVKRIDVEYINDNRARIKAILRNGEEPVYNDTVVFPEDNKLKDKFSVRLTLPFCGGNFPVKMEYFKNVINSYCHAFFPINAKHDEHDWLFQYHTNDAELKKLFKEVLVNCLGFRCTPLSESKADIYRLTLEPFNTKISKSELAEKTTGSTVKSVRSIVALLWTDAIKSSVTCAESMVRLPMGKENLENFKKALAKSKLTVEDLMKMENHEVLEFFKRVANTTGFQNELSITIKVDLDKIDSSEYDEFRVSGAELFEDIVLTIAAIAEVEIAFTYESQNLPGVRPVTPVNINNSSVGISVK